MFERALNTPLIFFFVKIRYFLQTTVSVNIPVSWLPCLYYQRTLSKPRIKTLYYLEFCEDDDDELFYPS